MGKMGPLNGLEFFETNFQRPRMCLDDSCQIRKSWERIRVETGGSVVKEFIMLNHNDSPI
jgi:hypothetical protein